MKDQKPSVTLALMHHIHLSREQRYSLHSGEPVEVVGVVVPVWHMKGSSSEPAVEVFCRYVLYNNPEWGNDIKQHPMGYEFNLPQPEEVEPFPELSDDDWRKLSTDAIESLWRKHKASPSSESLLDLGDRGCRRIAFNQYGLASVHGNRINMTHFVRIDPIEDLVESLV